MASTAQILPRELRLAAPPTMPQARTYLFQQQSTNSTYDPTNSGSVQINIPRLQRSYLTKDSYLKFRVGLKYKNAALASSGNGIDPAKVNYAFPTLDVPGALGLIDRIEIYDYLGSTLLESTAGHGQLMSLLMDLSADTLELGNHYNASSGTRGCIATHDNTSQSVIRTTVAAGSAPAAAVVNMQSYPNYIVRGALVGSTFSYNLVTSTDAPVVVEYCIPLFSFLGLLSPKFAPLHNGYTIQLTLNTLDRCMGFIDPHNTGLTNTVLATVTPSTIVGTPGVYDTATYEANKTALTSAKTAISSTLVASTIAPTSYTLSNVYFCAQVLELGPVAESMLISSTQGAPLVVPAKAFRNYVGRVPKEAQNYRLDLNLNVASLTNILFIMRPELFLNSVMYRSLSYRVRNYLQSWYFQYGSTILPQTSGIQCRSPPGHSIDTVRAPLSTAEINGVVLDTTTGYVFRNGGAEEAYNELIKSRHNLNASVIQTGINKDAFQIDTPYQYWLCERAKVAFTGGETLPSYAQFVGLHPFPAGESGKFAGGLDLELVSGRSNELICGMNTNGMNTSIFLNFDPNETARGADIVDGGKMDVRVDAWCEYDAFVNISPGIATTVSF